MGMIVDHEELDAELFNALEYSSKPPGIRPRHLLAIALTAIAMLILVLLYLGLIGLIITIVGYYATNFRHLLDGGIVHGSLYIGPMVVGAFAALFMTKPILSRREWPEPAEGLDEADHPLLFSLVRNLAGYTRSPCPTRIIVDLNADASATVCRMGREKELVLIVGLPVVASMSVQQISGIIARELAQFSQDVGMHLWRLTNQGNDWLKRAALAGDGRDGWPDDWPERHRSNRLFNAIHVGIWFTRASRAVPWILWLTAQPIIRAMSRRLEFDADRKQVYVCGSDDFANTLLRMQLLQSAHKLSMDDVPQAWREGRLAEDLIDLCKQQLNNGLTNPALVQQCRRDLLEEPAGWFAKYPGGRARIASADREELAPAITSELPAAVLLNDFKKLCRNETAEYYRRELGIGLTCDERLPANERWQQQIVASCKVQRDSRVAVDGLH